MECGLRLKKGDFQMTRNIWTTDDEGNQIDERSWTTPPEISEIANSIGEMTSACDSRVASAEIKGNIQKMIDTKMMTELKEKIVKVLNDESKSQKTSGECSFFKDGKLYKGNFTKYVDIEDTISGWIKQLSEDMSYIMMEQVNEYYRKCARLLNEVNSKISVFVTPPDLKLAMQYNIKVGSFYDEARKKLYVTYALPFVYHPKYVNGYPIVSPRIPAKQVYIVFPYVSFLDQGVQKMALQVSYISLVDINMKTVPHYHNNSMEPIVFVNAGSCWGHIRFESYYSVEALPALRDSLQLVLENINKDSPYNRSPQGLPSLDEIKVDTTKGVVWRI
jgi:hypothetical protein